jgi:dihydroflavonol-4-reductase
MKVGFTGATGFLGRHAVPRLAVDHEVVAISRGGAAPDGVRGVAADVLDADALTAAFEGCEVVVHAAGRVSHDLANAQSVYEVHVDGTRNTMLAARAAGVRRVVMVSSSGTIAVSDDPDFLGTEDGPSPAVFTQSWPYYRAKLYAEQVALEAADAELEVVCLNPSLLLGPGDDAAGASTHAVRVFLDEGVPVAPPGGISFVDVRDLAEAIVSALTAGQSGHRYLLAGGNMRFREFYDRLARITGRTGPVGSMPGLAREALRWFPRWGRERGIGVGFGPTISREDMELASHFWYADSSRASAAFGWVPRGPGETLDDTVADILDRRGRAFEKYRPARD